MPTLEPPPPPPKVQKTSFVFKSDLRKSDHASSPNASLGGILHATRSSFPSGGGVVVDNNNGLTMREEQAFAWVSNYDAHVHDVVSHLERYGYELDGMGFLPYSSKSAWVHRYPHAYPHVNCDVGENITGFPHWSPQARSAMDIPPEVVDLSTCPSVVEAIARGERATEGAVRRDRRRRTSRAPVGGLGQQRLCDAVQLTNAERGALHVEIRVPLVARR